MDNVEFLKHISYEGLPDQAAARDLIDCVRYDGQPLNSEQMGRFLDCSVEDFQSVVVFLESERRASKILVRLHDAAVRLIDGEPEARTLDEVGRIRRADPGDLLAEESGIDRGTVRLLTQL